MLTAAEARDAILAAIPAFDTETVPVDAATDKILRQSVTAERDQPPFDRVTRVQGGRRLPSRDLGL